MLPDRIRPLPNCEIGNKAFYPSHCVPAATDILPLTETVSPADQAELAEVVREAAATATPVYPLGGQTALGFGIAARRPGIGLSLAQLNRIVEYPARDMTITVEAGITLESLASTLSAERQRLAVDAAQADRATLGGLIATNFSGPRRYGCGTIRDYVIGISAVDGRGIMFKGGGRVVKNVAGYDFCKLLTGSLGTLGVMTQVTLKLRPQPESSAFAACDVANWDQAERLLAALVNSQTTPTAVELLCGPAWSDLVRSGPKGIAQLLVGLEGTNVEVAWMIDRLRSEWQDQQIGQTIEIKAADTAAVWDRLTDFPSSPPEGDSKGIVLKATVMPSSVVRFIQQVLNIDRQASIQAHAGNGVVLIRLGGLKTADLAGTLVKTLQPAATAAGGNIVVYAAPEECGLTRQSQWGAAGPDAGLMRSVKEQFDPHGILNPGRFVFGK